VTRRSLAQWAADFRALPSGAAPPTPAMTDRAALGRATYARNFDVTEAEAKALMKGRAGADFTHEAFQAAGGPGWQSTTLTDRDRAIAVIAALVSQNVTDV